VICEQWIQRRRPLSSRDISFLGYTGRAANVAATAESDVVDQKIETEVIVVLAASLVVRGEADQLRSFFFLC